MKEGEVKDKMAVPSPEVRIESNPKEMANDRVNDIILGLEGMAEGTQATHSDKIEKTTSGKITEVVKWVSAIVAGVYVILSLRFPLALPFIDNCTIIYIRIQEGFYMRGLDTRIKCNRVSDLYPTFGPVCGSAADGKQTQRL